MFPCVSSSEIHVQSSPLVALVGSRDIIGPAVRAMEDDFEDLLLGEEDAGV